MKHPFIWLLALVCSSLCVSPVSGQDCQPLGETSNLARTSHTLNQTIGINAGFDIERFFGKRPGYSGNQDSILLDDVKATSPIIRFFYAQDKDYDDNKNPRETNNLGDLSASELINVNDRSSHLSENYVRIQPLFEAGFEVQVAIEIAVGRIFPNKWWTLKELSREALINPVPNMDRVIAEVSAEGKDWATAFLKVYDPRNPGGNFSLKPIVSVLELGNEPWGEDLGKEGYRAYIKGMYEAFVEYYNHPKNFRIKLAGAAFQGHHMTGTDFWSGPLLDYVGTMIGQEGNSAVDLGPLRNALTEGVGVHNYSFTDYCKVDAYTLVNHPERAGNGFLMYQNISEWVNNNMPAGTQKVNATEYGWNSDYEPILYFPCKEGKVNQYGGCDEIANYDELVAISLDGRRYDYQLQRLTDEITQSVVGRTAQAAYIIRSTLMLSRWGVNKAILYSLLDDWSNPIYFSNGLIDVARTLTTSDRLEEVRAIAPNPAGKKESWYAVKRLKEVLGDKYFIQQYGSETDEGIYTYAFGDTENGPPTHLVTWNAININELNGGQFINVKNDNKNINEVQRQTTALNITSLNLPAGTALDFSQSAIYLNGKHHDDWVELNNLIVNNDPTTIKVSPIPVVLPLIAEFVAAPIPCHELSYTIENENQLVILNEMAPVRIAYLDQDDPNAPPINNIVCHENCGTTEIINLPPGNFTFTVDFNDIEGICSEIFSVEIFATDTSCDLATITNDDGRILVATNTGSNATIQVLDLLNDRIIISDNQGLTNRLVVELSSGNYLIKIDGAECQTISIPAGSTADFIQCQGATIYYGGGQVSVNMDDGQRAGIQIHDVGNNWIVVGFNQYQTNNLAADLPEGQYVVKINDITCETITLGESPVIIPPNILTCHGATITYGDGEIAATIDNGQVTGIQIHDLLNNWIVVAANGYSSNALTATLPAGEYLVKINDNQCESIILTNESGQPRTLESRDLADAAASVLLFPNPARNYIQVHIPKLEGLAGTISIYDAYGHLLNTHLTDAFHIYERLELTNAKNGLYFLTIKAENRRRIGKRFVVEDGK